MPIMEPITLPDVSSDVETQIDARYRVLIHNDDVTTFDYVINILGDIFMLSAELAEHIAWTTHKKGAAVVVIRPRSEAEKLSKVANHRSRGDGYPLTFSTEPDN